MQILVRRMSRFALLWHVERRKRFWLGDCFEKRFCDCISFFVISIRYLDFLKFNLALLFADIIGYNDIC